MSSAICFNLDQSKLLSSGNGLRFTSFIKQSHILRTPRKRTIEKKKKNSEEIENAGKQQFIMFRDFVQLCQKVIS